jgi:hypothetical protein
MLPSISRQLPAPASVFRRAPGHPAVLLSMLVCTAGAAQAQTTKFLEVGEAWGIDFKHADGSFSYAMAGGAAWLDFDNDGDEDLYCSSSQGRAALYRNDGPGQFTDVGVAAGLVQSVFSEDIGVIALDYNADGWQDLYVTSAQSNRMYQNQGDGTFVNVAASLGIDSSRWSACSAAADFERDGDLDIYVGNYVDVLNFPYHFGEPNELYVNAGTPQVPAFSDQAPVLGVDDTTTFGPSLPAYPQYVSPTGLPTAGCTLSICTLDYDEDGDADLMVGNDFGEFVQVNRQFRNDLDLNAGLAFTSVEAATNFDERPHYNMGIVGADYDHDGDWDFYFSNLGDNLLLRDEGGTYTDQTFNAGPVEGQSKIDPTALLSSWGIVFEDLDNDTWADLYVVNGLIPAATFIYNDFRAKNGLHLNNGDGTFSEVPYAESGADDEGAGRGVAVHDVDRDGWLDFYVMNNGAAGVAASTDRSRMYVNQMVLEHPERDFLQVRLRARDAGNWQAFGSRVELESDGLVQKRQVLCDPIFLSSSSREVHFGLGVDPIVERLDIHWASGTFQRLVSIPSRLQVQLREPLATIESLGRPIYDAQAAALPVRATLRNSDTQDQLAGVLFQFYASATGNFVTQVVGAAVVPAGQTADVTAQVPLSPATFAAFQGVGLEVRAYAVAADAFDSRSLLFNLN